MEKIDGILMEPTMELRWKRKFDKIGNVKLTLQQKFVTSSTTNAIYKEKWINIRIES